MGLLSGMFHYARARAARRLMTRVLGGPLSTALMAAFLGKKAYNYYRSRRGYRVA